MITIKTPEEIEIMKQGGCILRKVIGEVVRKVAPGITTAALNQKAEELIMRYGAYPSFKTVKEYQWATCLPVNNQIVHTPPSDRVLKDGDVLTIDIGVYYRSYHTDYATSLIVGVSENALLHSFLSAGEETLKKAIQQARVGNRIGHISQTIDASIRKYGYSVIKDLTGHGIGKKLHEGPLIFGYCDRPLDQTVQIKKGMTLAIEIIYAMNASKIKHEKGNKWSLVTQDGSISACFEKTIAIGETKAFILT